MNETEMKIKELREKVLDIVYGYAAKGNINFNEEDRAILVGLNKEIAELSKQL